MGIERDIERINGANTLEEIRAVVREYQAKAFGNGAALYSGMVGDTPASQLAVERASKVRSSIIDNTPRGRFLTHKAVDDAIRVSVERIFLTEGANQNLAEKLRDDFFYGDASAPKNSYTSIHNCLWCEASREFAASLTGDVKVIAVKASPSRVFAQVEIPTALQNPNVRSLGGLPLDILRATYAQHGVEGLLARVQANYAEEATHAGLLPASAAQPVAGLRRAPVVSLRVADVAVKGFGAAGAVASVYDGAASVRRASQLFDQGNDFGAQSHIVGAVSRNVGGLGGVALGASTGALITSETGPGAFIGGAVGGVVGAVAGDRLAAWIDDYRINHQTDPEGHRWHVDPGHPERGWMRTVTDELDAQATVDRGMPVYSQRTLVAPPELADRLNYQASSRAVELAMSAPPETQDPYRLPSTPEDHRPGHLYEGDWRRDADSVPWSRQVTDSHVGLSMQRFQTEVADPQQTMALDRRAQAIVATNAASTPSAMAANYEAAYEQFGWSRHGAMPAAVHDAIQPPDPTEPFFAALQSGDREGMRAAARAFAASDVGKQVHGEAMREVAEAQRALPGRNQPLFVQAMKHLEDLGPETARYRDDAGMERMAGAIAFQAKRQRMGGIDAIVPNGNGELTATWTNPGNRYIHYAAVVDPTLAAVQPLDRSFQQLSQETQEQAQQAVQREQALSQGHGMSR